jgi:hypothetical protein
MRIEMARRMRERRSRAAFQRALDDAGPSMRQELIAASMRQNPYNR